MLSQSLKNPISRCETLIDTVYAQKDKLDKLQEKKIPLLCKSILPQNLLWTSFTEYERTMEFIWVRRWRDNHLLIVFNVFLVQLHLASSLEKHIYYYRLDL